MFCSYLYKDNMLNIVKKIGITTQNEKPAGSHNASAAGMELTVW